MLPHNVVGHALVVEHAAAGYGRGKHHSLERAAPAECHIHLAWRKRGIGIDNGMVEGKSLALMYRDGPGQPQGVLFERAVDLSLNLFRVGVQRVARDRKSTRLNSSHANISYAVFC